MKKIVQVPLSETGPLATALRNGDAVELMDGDERVATVVPSSATSDRGASGRQDPAPEQRTGGGQVPLPSAEDERRQEAHIEKLIREGKITRHGTGKIPADFFESRPPKGGTGVLQQLLDDRRSGR